MANRKSFITTGLLLTGGRPGSCPAHETLASESPISDSNGPPAPPEVVHYQYKVIASYPHDRRAFTQGLVYEDGFLYEGTGLYGQSVLARRDLKTGKALKIDPSVREALRRRDHHLRRQDHPTHVEEQDGLRLQKDTFTLLKEFTYPTEGWGITHDGKRLIYSDGTATLRFLDPNTLDRDRPDRGPRPRAGPCGPNELEFINGLGLRQRLADRRDRRHRSQDRPRHRPARPLGPLPASRRLRGRPQRHRLDPRIRATSSSPANSGRRSTRSNCRLVLQENARSRFTLLLAEGRIMPAGPSESRCVPLGAAYAYPLKHGRD